jgi:Holliday junction DNA helicase RuvA
MIGYLSGTVIAHTEKSLTLLVGGVGYKVFVTEDALRVHKEQESVALFTYLAVRENALDLFGFESQEELSFFELLITISGIGPRSALAILSAVALPTLRQAITTGDSGYLTKVSGIGKKTAERLVVEMRDKLKKEGIASASLYPLESAGESQGVIADAISALMNLGYNNAQAQKAIKTALSKTEEKPELATLITAALRAI